MDWLWLTLPLVVAGAVAAGASGMAWRWRGRARALATENERWQRVARERADRVSIVSHEVQTPLALIGGATELLGDGIAGPLTPDQADLVETIAEKAREMTGLAADLLVDAKIDAQIFQMRTVDVDVGRVARRVVKHLRELHPNQITFSSRGAAARIVGDPELIGQVVTNLVNNAARHAGTGARITVRVRRLEAGVLLSVSDDGTGMPPETARELFRRTLAGKSAEGHGLGMLITRRIVQLHGGDCLVDSLTDVGTTVVCTLPVDGASLAPADLRDLG